MPPKTEKVGFVFDPQFFINGMRKLQQSLAGFMTNTHKMGEGLNKTIEKGVFWAQAKLQMIKSAGMALINVVRQNVPEIGMVAERAGGIIMKNLFWPIRQRIAPYLQKILNWVRDNRVVFVKIGSALANIIDVMIIGLKTLISWAKRFAEGFWQVISKQFFGGTKDITEAINLVMAKIAFLFAFLKPIIEPVMKALGELIGNIVILGEKIFEGFFKGINLSLIKDIGKAFMDLGIALGLIKANGEQTDMWTRLQKVFEGIGGVIAGIVNTVFALIVTMTKSIEGMIKMAQNFMAIIQAGIKGDWNEVTRLNKEGSIIQTQIGKDIEAAWLKVGGSFGKAFETMGEGITGKEKPVNPGQTSVPAPGATGSIGQWTPMSLGSKTGGSAPVGQVNANIAVNLNVTEGDAKKAGENFAAGMSSAAKGQTFAENFYKDYYNSGSVPVGAK